MGHPEVGMESTAPLLRLFLLFLVGLAADHAECHRESEQKQKFAALGAL
eukprot:SAG11_NODE_1304_length_5250_cov_5.457581_4_plen_49_part_00